MFDNAALWSAAHAPRMRYRLEMVVLFILAYALRRPEPVDVTQQWLPEDLMWLSFFFIAFIDIVFDSKRALQLLRESLPLVLLLLLIGASMLWSNEPATTARRSIALLGTTLLALQLVSRLGLRGFAESLAIAISLTAVISGLLIALVPNYGLQEGFGYNGAWRGCFFEKNDLGQAMALGIITLTMLLEGTRGIRRRLAIGLLCLFVVLLIGSQSAGSIGTVALFAVAFPLWLWIRKSHSRRLATLASAAIVVAILGACVTGFGTSAAFGALGRDATLTGRTDVWDAAFNAIRQRPVLGYGYREFWNKDGDSKYFLTPNEDGWLADTAHNGFIEVALDIGIVGEAVLIAFLALGAVRVWRCFWRGTDRLSAWPLFALAAVVLQNFTDRSFTTQDSVLWIVLVGAFWLATDAAPERRRAAGVRKIQKLSGRIAGVHPSQDELTVPRRYAR